MNSSRALRGIVSMVFSVSLLVSVTFVFSPASAAPVARGELVGGDYEMGQQDATSMAVYESELYVGTMNWIHGCEVWKYDGVTWTRVAMEGFGDATNDGVVSMAVFDSGLYAGIMNWEKGCEVWKYDGKQWERVAGGGFGSVGNQAASCMCVFDGDLYVGTSNSNGCQVWRTSDGTDFERVAANGFDDGDNTAASAIAEFDSELYLGTFNVILGGEVWRSGDGDAWNQVNADGFGNFHNEGISSLGVLGTDLYAGTWNNEEGCEIWSSSDGNTWNPSATGGFDDNRNVDAASISVSGQSLYVGTNDENNGCGVWMTSDGASWIQVNSAGFDSNRNIDASSMVEFRSALYVGTRGWDTGCEIWMTEKKGGPPYTDWTQVSVNGFAGATWYFAEGASTGGFETWILVANPESVPAQVAMTYYTDSGIVSGPSFELGAMSRKSVNIADTVESIDVSTRVVSNLPVVAERAQYYHDRQCATGSIGAVNSAHDWYFAEGASTGGFETWILVENPTDGHVQEKITYYSESGKVFGPDFTVNPQSRRSAYVGDTIDTYDVATRLVSDEVVVCERALYYNKHECATGSIGTPEPETDWYFAEGASAGGFETWILISNPESEAATANLAYMTDSGEVPGPSVPVEPESRVSVNVGDTVETFDVSTRVSSDQAVVAERAVYYNDRRCATGSIGVQEPAYRWLVGEGASAGGFETWILVSNPGTDIAHVDLAFMTDRGEIDGPQFDLAAGTRKSVNVADTVETFDVSTLVSANGKVVVERAVYYNDRQCATGSIGFPVD